MSVTWSPNALADVLEVYDYIAADNVSAARKMIERIRTSVERLAQNPALGRAGRVPGTRELIVGNYVIPYRSVRGNVEVLAVTHGARGNQQDVD